MAKLWCNTCKSSSARSQRSSEGQQCGVSPKNSLLPAVPFPGAISPTKASLISQRSLGAQGKVGTWIKDFGRRDTLSAEPFPGLSPCGQAWNPPRWVNTRAPWAWEELLPGAWDTWAGVCQWVLSTWGLPASCPCVCEGLHHQTMALRAQMSSAWNWWDWDLGAAAGQSSWAQLLEGCVQMCVSVTSGPLHRSARGVRRMRLLVLWGCSLCLSLPSVLPAVCVCTHVVINASCPSRGYLLSLSAGGTPGTELPQPPSLVLSDPAQSVASKAEWAWEKCTNMGGIQYRNF